MTEFITSNAGTIFILSFFAFIMYGRFKKKKGDLVKSSIQQQVQQQASAVGLQVTSQADGRVSDSGEIHGDTDYSGTTGGIEWTLKSTIQVTDRGEDRNQVWKRKSVWQTRAAKLPAGKFILLMSTPGEIKQGVSNVEVLSII